MQPILRRFLQGNPSMQCRYGYLYLMWPAALGKRKKAYWLCACDCGAYKVARIDSVKSGAIVSCGCKKRERALRGDPHKRHGMTDTSERYAFSAAKQRCTNPRDPGYKNYGGRGITFRFASFEDFYKELGPKPTPKHSVDRINNDGHYEPGNVRWATRSEQNKNTRRTKEATCTI